MAMSMGSITVGRRIELYVAYSTGGGGQQNVDSCGVSFHLQFTHAYALHQTNSPRSWHVTSYSLLSPACRVPCPSWVGQHTPLRE